MKKIYFFLLAMSMIMAGCGSAAATPSPVASSQTTTPTEVPHPEEAMPDNFMTAVGISRQELWKSAAPATLGELAYTYGQPFSVFMAGQAFDEHDNSMLFVRTEDGMYYRLEGTNNDWVDENGSIEIRTILASEVSFAGFSEKIGTTGFLVVFDLFPEFWIDGYACFLESWPSDIGQSLSFEEVAALENQKLEATIYPACYGGIVALNDGGWFYQLRVEDQEAMVFEELEVAGYFHREEYTLFINDNARDVEKDQQIVDLALLVAPQIEKDVYGPMSGCEVLHSAWSLSPEIVPQAVEELCGQMTFFDRYVLEDAFFESIGPWRYGVVNAALPADPILLDSYGDYPVEKEWLWVYANGECGDEDGTGTQVMVYVQGLAWDSQEWVCLHPGEQFFIYPAQDFDYYGVPSGILVFEIKLPTKGG